VKHKWDRNTTLTKRLDTAYERTINKSAYIDNLIVTDPQWQGYRLEVMWEHEYQLQLKNNATMKEFVDYVKLDYIKGRDYFYG